MRNFTVSIALGVTAIASSSTAMAGGLFGGGTALDPAYCNAAPPRETVIYIDDTDIVQNNYSWVRTIADKLQQTLMPGERTTVVELSPANGQSKEIWSGCWPGVTAKQQETLQHESHFFSGNPLSSLKEQQGFFTRDFGQAVTAIIKSTARPASDVAIDPTNPPKKSIVRSLASDGARFSHESGTIRTIVYSDMAENSELGSVYKPLPTSFDFGNQLGAFLRRSVFYVFGVGNNIKDDGHIADDIRKFWSLALPSMAANVAGLGSDLGLPNTIPFNGAIYNVTLQDAGNELHGRLSLLWDPEGRLVDSTLGITRLRSVLLNGFWRCAVDTKQCEISATTAGSLVTDSKSETLSMKSHGDDTLHGTIGVPGSSVNLPISAILSNEK